MSGRCEPPEGLRDTEGLHLIRYDTGDCTGVTDCWTWVPAELVDLGIDTSGFWTREPGKEMARMIEPDDLAEEIGAYRLRYLCPVPDPAELATSAAELSRLKAEVERLERENARMRKALKPFADWAASKFDGRKAADKTIIWSIRGGNGSAEVVVGDLVRARAALTRAEGVDDGE